VDPASGHLGPAVGGLAKGTACWKFSFPWAINGTYPPPGGGGGGGGGVGGARGGEAGGGGRGAGGGGWGDGGGRWLQGGGGGRSVGVKPGFSSLRAMKRVATVLVKGGPV